MTKEYRAKVFKSGNSVALRLPKALGLREGEEMILREEAHGFTFEPAPTERKFGSRHKADDVRGSRVRGVIPALG
jgi:virulence-associated protein VagC